MQTLLNIRASLRGADGESSKLADRIVRRWHRQNPRGHVVTRDLTPGAIPPLTADRFAAFSTAAEKRTRAQREDLALSDALVDELRAADVIVLAAPMYNFSVPAPLRDYFDHIARAGVTFRYSAAGPEGLLKGKKVYVVVTRGGRYGGTADTQIPYMRQFLGFIGLTDIELVLAEGLAMGDDIRAESLCDAHRTIDALEPLAVAA